MHTIILLIKEVDFVQSVFFCIQKTEPLDD